MPGEPGDYRLPDIVKWLRSDGPWRSRPKAEEVSAGLERGRRAKAELAELQLLERRGVLISTDRAKQIFQRWAIVLRNLGERLSKRYGNEAAAALNDSLNECGRVVDDELGPADATVDRVA
jgi:hypothetical protein